MPKTQPMTRAEMLTCKETITISKRNWYFIGKDSETIAFRFIRKIAINEHLFGANIWVKAIGGSVSAKYLPKKDLQLIKEKLIKYNQTKKKCLQDNESKKSINQY